MLNHVHRRRKKKDTLGKQIFFKLYYPLVNKRGLTQTSLNSTLWVLLLQKCLTMTKARSRFLEMPHGEKLQNVFRFYTRMKFLQNLSN